MNREMIRRMESEFYFNGLTLTYWHLNRSSYGNEIAVLKEDAVSKWRLFEVSGLGEGEQSVLMLRYQYEYDDEMIDRFYIVFDEEDAMRIVTGINSMRDSIFVGPGVHVRFDLG